MILRFALGLLECGPLINNKFLIRKKKKKKRRKKDSVSSCSEPNCTNEFLYLSLIVCLWRNAFNRTGRLAVDGSGKCASASIVEEATRGRGRNVGG